MVKIDKTNPKIKIAAKPKRIFLVLEFLVGAGENEGGLLAKGGAEALTDAGVPGETGGRVVARGVVGNELISMASD
ncbi:MAG TPA: hypothetical protein VMW04_02910 [Patescibacteria group bacterium]|nr:hypothetical protein [Patescibacteria group bacterium]